MNGLMMHSNNIENMIYRISDNEVMLDTDLAILYHVETKRINEAVRRNKDKFPERISWVLSDSELEDLWSQNATANISKKSRTNPRVFIEQGVYMLATILKSDTATEASIQIMDTFVRMRHYIKYNELILPNKVLLLENKLYEHDEIIKSLLDKFSPDDIVKDKVFFKGEFYDAYSLVVDILASSKEEIIIIDNYIDKKLLDILKTINRKIMIVTSNISKILKEKYESQYHNVIFVRDNTFHDRFIILDREKIYICGASLKDVGKKCFHIGEIKDDKVALEPILEYLDNKI